MANRFGVVRQGDEEFFDIVDSLPEARAAVLEDAGNRLLEMEDCRSMLVADRDWMLRKAGRYPLEVWRNAGEPAYWIWEVKE